MCSAKHIQSASRTGEQSQNQPTNYFRDGIHADFSFALLPCLRLCCCRFEQYNLEFDNDTRLGGRIWEGHWVRSTSGSVTIRSHGKNCYQHSSFFTYTNSYSLGSNFTNKQLPRYSSWSTPTNKQTTTRHGGLHQTNNYHFQHGPPSHHRQLHQKLPTTSNLQLDIIPAGPSNKQPPRMEHHSIRSAPFQPSTSPNTVLLQQQTPDHIRPDQTRPDSTRSHGSCTDASLRSCDPTTILLPGYRDIGIERMIANGETQIIF